MASLEVLGSRALHRLLAKLSSLARRPEHWAPAALGLLYVAVAGTFNRLRFAYELDPDEGFNLMKVMLVARGHALYREVWSDQPPGFTYLGVLFVRLFGESVDNVRLVTMLLTGLLVFAQAELLRRSLPGFAGLAAAVASTAMLPAGANLSRYSMAAMIGLPSIALAVASLLALVVSRSRERRWLLVAGAAFAASLSVKLFTAFLLPILGGLLFWQARAAAPEQWLRSAARAGAYFVAGFVPMLLLGLGPALSESGIEQLYGTHVEMHGSGRSHVRLLARYLGADAWLYALALAGLVLAVLRQNVTGLVFGAFSLSSLAILSAHSPLWHHHCLLVSVPACALAGFFVGRVAFFVKERLRGAWRVLGFAPLVAGLVAVNGPLLTTQTTPREREAKRQRQEAVDDAIRKHAPAAKLMVTARQIRAFRLGIPVPPELAVTSKKRFRSGRLSARDVRSIVLAQEPDVVVLDERWPKDVRNALKRIVRDGYRFVYADKKSGDAAVYVRITR